MKNLISLLVGIFLGIFGLALFMHMLPWQKPTLDEIYKQSQNLKNINSGQTAQTIASDAKNQVELISQNSAPLKQFMSFAPQAVDAMNSYNQGTNMLVDGLNSSTYKTDNFGDYTELNLNGKIYEAKGCFQKIIADFDLITTNNLKETQIKELFIHAAILRIEGISLITKGFLLRQERGQIRSDNGMHDMALAESGSAIIDQQGEQTIPSYNGECEEGYGKIKSANLYFVDAVKLFKDYREQFPNYDAIAKNWINWFINSYSDKPES